MGKRVKFISIVFVALLGIMAFRAVDLQILRADQIISQASRRFDHTASLSPHRGNILDINGEPLAISLDVKSIAANPRKIENPARAARQLSNALDMNRAAIQKKLSSKKSFVWIKRHASPDEVSKVRNLEIKGMGYFDEAKRFYPETNSLANILGIVGIDGNGLEGIELEFDRVLMGKTRHVQIQKDGLRRVIYPEGLSPETEADGSNLVLTIDRRIQYIASKELMDAVRENNARSGFVIITDPYTGTIHAMASYPSFNPNIGSYRNLNGHKNRAITDVFEPGSVIKPFWIGWGLEEGIFAPDQNVFCENGRYRIHRKTFRDHKKYGWLGLRDIIRHSSNIGMIKLTEPVSPESMHAALENFGFDDPTEISFPGEPSGMIPSPSRWTSIDKASISFGQGFTVTGIELITAFNSLVNGGTLFRPRLVDHITDADGGVIETIKPSATKRIISKKNSDEIVSIMKSVTQSGGTADTAGMNNYQVFGKTGTAQKVDPLTRSYSNSSHRATFIGGIIDGTTQPVLTMVVSIDDPHPNYYARTVACPVFKDIASRTLNIMDIRPAITVAQKGN